MSEFVRSARSYPAYDCILVQPCKFGSDLCKPGAGGSHGRGCATLCLTVTKDGKTASLEISTGWGLEATHEWQDSQPSSRQYFGDGYYHQYKPKARCISFHSPSALYDEDYSPADKCDFVEGPCYTDAGFSMADEPFRILREEGSDACYEALEAIFKEFFDGR